MTLFAKLLSSLFTALASIITRLLGFIGLAGVAVTIPLIIPMLTALTVGIGAISFGAGIYSLFKGTVTTHVDASLVGFNPVDKLFTAYAIVPHIDAKMERTKTSLVKTWVGLEDIQHDPTGYCYRMWQVGIGYENLTTLFDQHHSAICADQPDKLPQPAILSAESIPGKNMVNGEYTRQACDFWESEDNTTWWQGKIIMAREAAIMDQLINKAKVWNAMTERSQKILTAYLRLYCPLDRK